MVLKSKVSWTQGVFAIRVSLVQTLSVEGGSTCTCACMRLRVCASTSVFVSRCLGESPCGHICIWETGFPLIPPVPVQHHGVHSKFSFSIFAIPFFDGEKPGFH